MTKRQATRNNTKYLNEAMKKIKLLDKSVMGVDTYQAFAGVLTAIAKLKVEMRGK